MDTLYQLLEWNPVQVGSTFHWGGRSAPPSSTPDPNKTSVGCKDETAQRGYFQQVDCFVASLVGSCSSSVLWVVAIAVVVVVVAVGSRCCCCGSELELELVHPPL